MEVTIDIPAERIKDVRYQLQVSITDAAEELDRFDAWGSLAENSRAAIAQIAVLATGLDQIGWSGEGEPSRLTLDRELLVEAIERGFEYVKDDVGSVEPEKLDTTLAELAWFKAQREELAEAVPA